MYKCKSLFNLEAKLIIIKKDKYDTFATIFAHDGVFPFIFSLHEELWIVVAYWLRKIKAHLLETKHLHSTQL